jgi:ChrR Cupin-like domain
MLVQWDPGYRMGAVEHHEYDEHLYILAGTFVDHNRACGPGTYILNRAGSEHQCSTPMDARSSKWCLADRRTDSTVDGEGPSTTGSCARASIGCASPTRTPSPRRRSSWRSTCCTTTAVT